MLFCKVLYQDLKRQFLTKSLWISIGLIMLVTLWSIQPYINQESTIMQVSELMFGLSMPKKLIILLAASSGAILFCQDWKDKYAYSICIRSGIRNYAWSKALSAFISAVAVSLIGTGGCFVLLSVRMPWYTWQDVQIKIQNHVPYVELLQSNRVILYILLPILTFALSAGICTLMAQVVSIAIPDVFTTLVSAFVINYVLETIPLPKVINLYLIARADPVLDSSVYGNIGYFFLYYTLWVIILSLVIHWGISRRVRHEWY